MPWPRQNRQQDAQKVRPAKPSERRGESYSAPYGDPLRFTTHGITRVTFVNAAETVRRQCLARIPLADFLRIPLGSHKGIGLSLPTDFRLGSMSGDHGSLFVERIQPFSNRLLDHIEISAPEIGAADGSAKQGITGQH